MNIQTTISPMQALLASCVPQLTTRELIDRVVKRRAELPKLQQACSFADRHGEYAKADRLRNEAADMEAAIAVDEAAIRSDVNAALGPLDTTLTELVSLDLIDPMDAMRFRRAVGEAA